MKQSQPSKPVAQAKSRKKTDARRNRGSTDSERMPAGEYEQRESENASGPRVPKRLDSGGPRGAR